MKYDQALIRILVLASISISVSQHSVAKIPLYLTNTLLDSYGPRQGSNTAYFGVFEVGTPPRQFTGCFDTGSADAWLPLSTCQSAACTTHDTYSPQLSSTYQGSTLQFSIQYATGSVVGNLATDVFNLGGITIQDQSFGAVSVAGQELLHSSCDGIFGFAFPKISQLQSTPPFFNMVQEGVLAQNAFSFWLSSDPSQEPAGELVVGGVNSQRYAGIVTYFDVANTTYWSVSLDNALVGSQIVNLAATTAIIDTGSTAITVGAQDGATLHQQIPGTTYWAAMGVYNITGGCSNVASLPNVAFVFAGHTFALPPSLWVIKYQGTCVSGFVPSGAGTQVVLGVTFLRAWHSQYSYDPVGNTAKVGLASSATTLASGGASSAQITFAGRRLLESSEETEQNMGINLFSANIPTAAERGLL